MNKVSEIELTKDLVRRARLLELAGNPTRIRIFCILFERGETCVSDIAASLQMSIASISHHLQMMRDNELLEAVRMGNKICYKPVKGELMNKLKKLICE
ncbi:MAG: winged helix-turn-helix transcriptional regulator [Candidatus Doudnabacteria bacterium]|nr:winged helix-turn-helix transcriptional regulator [Candidatus Doudnabacteria bacterium]